MNYEYIVTLVACMFFNSAMLFFISNWLQKVYGSNDSDDDPGAQEDNPVEKHIRLSQAA